MSQYPIRDVNYGYNINMNNQKETDLAEFYNHITINTKMNKKQTEPIHPNPIASSFIAKSYYYENISGATRVINSLPPKGPIRELTMCPYCKQEGPQYHLEDCAGPYNDEILTDEGIEYYSEKIIATYDDSELENLKFIFYKDIFPNRGLQRLLSEQYKVSSFPNVIQLKYITQPVFSGPIIPTELQSTIGNDHEDGIIIPMKVTKQLGVSAKNIPFYLPETYPKKFSTMIMKKLSEWNGSKIEENGTWITDMNCIFKITDNTQCLSMKKINTFIKAKINNKKIKIGNKSYPIHGYTFSSYTNSINFKILYQQMKASINIKGGGSVHLFLSYGTNDDKKWMKNEFIEKEERPTEKKLDGNGGIKMLNAVRNIVVDLINIIIDINKDENEKIIEDKKIQKSVYYDKKILNTSVPWTVDNGKFSYQPNIKAEGSFPPQPESCRNRVPKKTTLTKADIKRPVPFSFSQGKPPMKGLAIMDEGKISTGKKLLGGRKRLYEPCCEVIQGNSKGIKGIGNPEYEPDNFVITPKEMKEMYDSVGDINTDTKEFKRRTNTYLAYATSTREKLFRRMLYGFPNNKSPDDTAKRNHIKSGYEEQPILKSDEVYNNKKTKDFKRKKQSDIYSGVYVPGTQLKNFKGNNQLIRDTRRFKGLMDYNDESLKPLLLEMIECYFDKFSTYNDNESLPSLIPICDENLPEFLEKVQNNTIQYIITPKKAVYTTKGTTKGFEFENHFFSLDTEEIKTDSNIVVHYPIPLQEPKEISERVNGFEQLIAIDDKNNVYQWYNTMDQDYLQKSILQFKVEKKKNNNLIKITLPSGKNIDEDLIDLFPFNGDKYLFVPTKVQQKLKDNNVYRFAFNFFHDTDGIVKPIPNQPFVVVGGENPVPVRKIKDSDETVKAKLCVALQPIIKEEF